MIFLECSICHHQEEYSLDLYQCQCGNFYDIKTDQVYVPDDSLSGLWRYLSVLPIKNHKDIVSFQECFTPLEKAIIENRVIYLKHDYLLPSGSYKDRGFAVMVNRLRQEGINEVIEDSSGNAGSSLACYAAKAGIRCRIFVPETTSPAKTKQISAYGAEIEKVKGDRDKTAQVAMEYSKSFYYASHVYNPLFFQGIKTLAYELEEQLGNRTINSIFFPVGNGTLAIGLYLGFQEMISFGLIEKMPQLIGIQAENCAPLTSAFQGKDFVWAKTMAEGIAISNPARKKQILDVVVKSGGCFLNVKESEILIAHEKACRLGYYIEPTSAVVFAAFLKYPELFNENQINILIFTGHGLKSK